MALGLLLAAMEPLVLGEVSETFLLQVVEWVSSILRTKTGMAAVRSGSSTRVLVGQLVSVREITEHLSTNQLRIGTPQCQWFDNTTYVGMQKARWYSSAEALADGSIVLVGGFVNGGYINR